MDQGRQGEGMVAAVFPGVTLTERASRNTAHDRYFFLSHQNKSTSSIRTLGTPL
jgi:hypothetical protein